MYGSELIVLKGPNQKTASGESRDVVEIGRLLQLLKERNVAPIDSASWLLMSLLSSVLLQRMIDLEPFFKTYVQQYFSGSSFSQLAENLQLSTASYSHANTVVTELAQNIKNMLASVSTVLPLKEQVEAYLPVSTEFLRLMAALTLEVSFKSSAPKAEVDLASKLGLAEYFRQTNDKFTRCLQKGSKSLRTYDQKMMYSQEEGTRRYQQIISDCYGEINRKPLWDRVPNDYYQTAEAKLQFAASIHDHFSLWHEQLAAFDPTKQVLPREYKGTLETSIKQYVASFESYADAMQSKKGGVAALLKSYEQADKNILQNMMSNVLLMVCHLIITLPLSGLFQLLIQPLHWALKSTELDRIQTDFKALQHGKVEVDVKLLLQDLQRIEANPNVAERLYAYWPYIQVMITMFTTLTLYNPELLGSKLAIYVMSLILPIAMESIPATAKYVIDKAYYNPMVASYTNTLLLEFRKMTSMLLFTSAVDVANTWDEVFIQVQTKNRKAVSLEYLEAFDDACVDFNIPLMVVIDRASGSASEVFLLQAKHLNFYNRWGSLDASKVAQFSQHFTLRHSYLQLKSEINKRCKPAVTHYKIGRYFLIDDAKTNAITLVVQKIHAEMLAAFHASDFDVDVSNHSAQIVLTNAIQAKDLLTGIFKATISRKKLTSDHSPVRHMHYEPAFSTSRLRQGKKSAPRPPSPAAAAAPKPAMVAQAYFWNYGDQVISSDDAAIIAIPSIKKTQNPLFIMSVIPDEEFAAFPPLLWNRYQGIMQYPHMAGARKGASGIVSQDDFIKMKFKGAMGDYRIESRAGINCTQGQAKLFVFYKITTH